MSKFSNVINLVSDLSRELNLEYCDGESPNSIRLVEGGENKEIFECWIDMGNKALNIVWRTMHTGTRKDYFIILGICEHYGLEYVEAFKEL